MFSRSAVFALCLFSSLFLLATANPQLGDAIDSLTDKASSVVSTGIDGASSVASEITDGAKTVGTFVTSVGKDTFTVVTDGAGKAITLASSGIVTTFAGGVYTALADDQKPNAALAISMPLVTGLIMALSSILCGAWIIL